MVHPPAPGVIAQRKQAAAILPQPTALRVAPRVAPPIAPHRASIVQMSQINDDAPYNWGVVAAYSPDTANAILRVVSRTAMTEKAQRKAIISGIRAAGYGGAKIAHKSKKSGYTISSSTKAAIKAIGKYFTG
jgi:hypothetical protein